jgi:hypothetical protein
MNKPALLHKMVATYGQAAVARAIGYSTSAVNQTIHGKYKGNQDNLLRRVVEVYGTGTVMCPVMGEITIKRCAAERRKPFAATSPQRVRLHQACSRCAARR